MPSLSGLKPAVHIATPILKVVDAQVPGLDERSWILQKLGKFPRRGCFLYGGRWMAKPVHPPGLKPDRKFWHSTNQQFAGLPDDSDVKPDDYAFLRPTQSEFMLQTVRSDRRLFRRPDRGDLAGAGAILVCSWMTGRGTEPAAEDRTEDIDMTALAVRTNARIDEGATALTEIWVRP